MKFSHQLADVNFHSWFRHAQLTRDYLVRLSQADALKYLLFACRQVVRPIPTVIGFGLGPIGEATLWVLALPRLESPHGGWWEIEAAMEDKG